MRFALLAGMVMAALLWGASTARAECQFTHGELIDVIVEVADLQKMLPKELPDWTIEEQYRYKVSLLISLGYPKDLDGYTHDYLITIGYFAEIFYEVFGEKTRCPAVSQAEKILCLIKAGFLSPDYLLDGRLCREDVAIILHGRHVHERPISPVVP